MASGQGNGSEIPRQEGPHQGAAVHDEDGVALADDADMYEDLDDKSIASALLDYLAENSLDGAVLRLGDAEAPLPDLWQAVVDAGGYETVSVNKGWAAIGRAFGASKMTDLSHRVKKGYEKMLLPFEQALERGDLTSIVVPGRHRMKGVKGLQLQGKVAKRKGRPKSSEAALVGQRILVKWNVPDIGGEALYIGTVQSYKKGLHFVTFDDGDEVELNLAEEAWCKATLADEDEAAANAGLLEVAGRKLHLPRLAAAGASSDEPDMAWTPLGGEQHEGVGAEDSILVAQGDGYQVRKVELAEGQSSYEIHAQLPGIGQEGVKVKCWPEGRVRIRGTPDAGVKTWVPAPIERSVQLPEPIDPYSARALLTLHGLLLVTANAAEPAAAAPEPAPAAAPEAAPAADAAAAAAAPAPAAEPAAAPEPAAPAAITAAAVAPATAAAPPAGEGMMTLQESPMEGLPEPGKV